jgi:hypothetical protein
MKTQRGFAAVAFDCARIGAPTRFGSAAVDQLRQQAQISAVRAAKLSPWQPFRVVETVARTIDPGDHEGVSRAEKVEQDLQFGSSAASCAARLFGPDHLAAGRLQHATLQAKVLVDRRDSGIAVGRHWGCRPPQMILDVPRVTCQNSSNNSIETGISSHRSASVG